MSEPNDHKLVLSRLIDAPIERVWQAWTEQDKIKGWWGPRGVTNPTCEWDARVGGQINITMLAGQELGPMAGQEWPMSGEFKEVVPTKKLVFTSSPIMDGKPIMDSLCNVDFEESGDKTKLTLTITVSNITSDAEGPLAGMEMGWSQSLDKLSESLSQGGKYGESSF